MTQNIVHRNRVLNVKTLKQVIAYKIGLVCGNGADAIIKS